MKKTSSSVYNSREANTGIRIGRDAMRNPWAIGLIILFSLLFLIGVNTGELDFLYNLGRTV
jgi:hypothetical protein